MELLTRSSDGDLEFDLPSGVLRRAGEPVALRPMATAALSLLARHRGELVTRDQLKRALWEETVVDYDACLNQVMRQLRSALGDHGREPRLIETVPRRGYRLRPRPNLWSRSTRDRVHGFVAGAGLGLGLPALLLVIACALLAT